MNKTKNKLLLLVTLILCILLFARRLTDGILHDILGLALLIILVVHLCMTMKKMKYRARSLQIVDALLLGTMTVLMVSGILLHPLHDVLIVLILHKLSAVLFVLGLIAHVVQHKK